MIISTSIELVNPYREKFSVLNFEQTKDYALIRSIMAHEKVYPHLTDDFSPPREEWQPLEHESLFYLLVKDVKVDWYHANYGAEEVLGVFLLQPQNAICWEVHTCFLPSAWGARIAEAGRKGHEWIFDNTNCRRIVTQVPEYNRIALRFAERSGMERYGLNRKSFQKDGKLWDVILLGVSKGGE